MTTLGAGRRGKTGTVVSLMATLGAGCVIGGGSVKVVIGSCDMGGWAVLGFNREERRGEACTGAEGDVVSTGFADGAGDSHRWQAARKSPMAFS